MNAFYEHHKNNIRFAYRCFDRILLNAPIQPFQQEQRVVGFFDFYRQIYPVSRQLLHDIATQYHNWVKNRSHKWGVPIHEDPPGRRDDFVKHYFRGAQPDQVVAIIKAREPATILKAIGKDDRWHLEMKHRWVDQYNFYLQDSHWGQMFVRVCPYFPFSARVCLNQHYWLALRLQERGIRFRQCANAFLQCSDPDALQKLADSLTADDLITCLPTDWSADGKAVIFASNRTGHWSIYKQRLDQESSEMLFRGAEGAEPYSPKVSPDGSWVVYLEVAKLVEFTGGPARLMRVPIGGGSP